MIISNFNNVSILYLDKFEIRVDEHKIYFSPPKLKDTLVNDFNFFMAFCSISDADLRKYFQGISFVNRYGLLTLILSEGGESGVVLYRWFQKCIEGFKYADDSLKVGDLWLSNEVFELICTYVAISCGQKKIDVLKQITEEENLTPAMREWNRRLREDQEKIDRARAKASEGKGAELDVVIACLVREFRLSLEEIFNMTYYTIFFLFSQIGKIARYDVDVIAAGMGSLKKGHKHKHWVNA